MHSKRKVFEDHPCAELDMKILNGQHRAQLSARIMAINNGILAEYLVLG